MFEKGPGHGYMAAKDEALALKAGLKCKRVVWNGLGIGYHVYDPKDNDRQYGRGALARDAWAEAVHCLKTGTRPSLEKSW
jgi:hypothetical protein